MGTSTKLQKLFDTLGYDVNEGTVTVDDLKIYLEIRSYSNAESSFCKDYWYATGTYRIVLGKKTMSKTYPNILADFYHCVGHIKYLLGQLSLDRVNDFCQKVAMTPDPNRPFEHSVIDAQTREEMASDEYALKQREYNMSIDAYLPLLRKNEIRTSSNQSLYFANMILRLRRSYLEELISENASVSNKHWAFVGSSKSATSAAGKKHKSRTAAINALEELADAMGFGAEKQQHPSKNKMKLAADEMKVSYNMKDGFKELCEKMISAISGPADSSKFTISKVTYKSLAEKPKDWETSYDKYFYRNSNTGEYLHVEGVPPEGDGNESTADENVDFVAPPFSCRYCRAHYVKNDDMVNSLRERYGDIIEDFVSVQLDEYNASISAQERNEIARVTGNVLLRFILSEKDTNRKIPVPRHSDITREIEACKGLNMIESEFRVKTSCLMSYKDRKNQYMAKHPIRPNESLEEYEQRIYVALTNPQK